MYRLVPALVHEMGEAYPELGRAQALISETLKLEETRFRSLLERGLGLLDEASRGLKKGDALSGDTAFKLYSTYGFPLDLTQDALQAARHHRRHRRLRRRDGGGEGQGAQGLEGLGRGGHGGRLVRGQGEGRRHRLPGLRDRDRRGRGAGHRQGRQGGEEPQGRRRGGAGAQPDAVLRRVRRPGRRPGHHPGAQGRAVPRHRHAEAAGRPHRPLRPRREGQPSSRATPWRSRWTTPAARRRAPTTPPPTSCTRRCARCWAPTWPRRARWWRPTGCASTSRTPSRWRRTRSRPSRRWPTPSCCRTRPSRPA